MTRATLTKDTERLRPKGPEHWVLETEDRKRFFLGPVAHVTMNEALAQARALGYDATCSTSEPAVLQGVE